VLVGVDEVFAAEERERSGKNASSANDRVDRPILCGCGGVLMCEECNLFRHIVSTNSGTRDHKLAVPPYLVKCHRFFATTGSLPFYIDES